MTVTKREWLKDALFYEIYPQSFMDTNADGIGDIQGIIGKLDYILSIGCNAIWLNPCFDSPFMDAGYDVRDYYRVAPRYGTNEDLKRLFEEAHKRGMHVLLDLVPGHTSNQCRWFIESSKEENNEFTDRYVWTDDAFNAPQIGSITGWIRGEFERCGSCAANFYTIQPALNYGFYEIDEGEEAWEQKMDAPGPMATREAIKDIMRFWLGLGCDGFRVDMAGSLVKNDPEQKGTISLWHEFRAFLEEEFPEAVMVSEWGQPDRALEAGFQMDFLLHFGPSHYNDLFRCDHPYFTREGKGECREFFELYEKNFRLAKENGGMICIPCGNHDMVRLAKYLDPEEIKIAFAFLMSMPGVPFTYYGDEIGMHYVEGLKSVEGGYYRTGSRSPMAWNRNTNAGFSSAPVDALYIAQDKSKREINVESEEADPNSVLQCYRMLTGFRKAHPALGNAGDIEFLSASGYPLVYVRTAADESEKILVVINPSGSELNLRVNLPETKEFLLGIGGMKNESELKRNSDGSVTIPAAGAGFYVL